VERFHVAHSQTQIVINIRPALTHQPERHQQRLGLCGSAALLLAGLTMSPTYDRLNEQLDQPGAQLTR